MSRRSPTCCDSPERHWFDDPWRRVSELRLGLRKFIIFGKRHLDYLLAEFTDYYNTARSSMVRDHLPPVRGADPEEVATLTSDQIETRTYVGGLVTAFARKAA